MCLIGAATAAALATPLLIILGFLEKRRGCRARTLVRHCDIQISASDLVMVVRYRSCTVWLSATMLLPTNSGEQLEQDAIEQIEQTMDKHD